MSKSNTNRERRDMVEQMRKQARASERRRTTIVIAACVAVALVIVSVAGYSIIQDRQETAALKQKQLTDIGAAAADAGCGSIQEEKATGESQHTTDAVDYAVVPPAFGAHNPTADDSGSHFYTTSDRPEVEILVHNLEHGWTIAWYDETIADDADQMRLLKATAEKFDAEGDNPEFNMIIAPWTEDDGGGRPIPDGKHIAFTHWSIHQPVYKPPTSDEPPPAFGQSLYCDTFSGAALDDFMKKYPYDDAPEGYLWHP
ncbi:MAG: DUF3105 domain-containing protein [Propionibacteriales bacterium]|nr:DUF3105 domain-containing protein [Propionibacteriales bacterium]